MSYTFVFKRGGKAALPKWWFPLHRGLMLSGVTVALTSFVVIVSTTHSAHFDGTHKLGGLILTIVLCLQPLNAFARPHKPAAGEEKGRTLRFAWRVAHAILGLYMLSHALYQMHSGIEWSGETFLYAIFGGGWTLALIAAAVGTVLTRRAQRAARSEARVDVKKAPRV